MDDEVVSEVVEEDIESRETQPHVKVSGEINLETQSHVEASEEFEPHGENFYTSASA